MEKKRSLASKLLILLLLLAVFLAGCSPDPQIQEQETVSAWPNTVFYQIFVRAFYDSDGDGIGDLNGVTKKLDYLQELGVEGIWLMPINPSPSYHKYDVTDYYDIDTEYGTLADMKNLVAEARERNIRVIMDLVVNHTSKQNPWFQDAYLSAESPYRDWYIWAGEDTNTNELGGWNQKVWSGSGKNTYYATFWEGMPDLNYDNPEVRAEIINVGTYWLQEIGVDGFRLDAAKWIYPDQEKEKNYEWWQEFRTAMEEAKPDVYLVGEVWAPVTESGPYLQNGLSSTFNFDLASKIVTTVRQEKDAGIVTMLKRTREYFQGMNQEFVDATFLTNHDMNRVLSELNGDLNQAKMAAALLLTLPGTPFIYYGEEIGLEGKKPDEYIREPFVWSEDPNTDGETSWITSRYNRERSQKALEVQLEDENSLYQQYKKLIAVRRSSEILVLGEIERSQVNETGLVAFKRVLGENSLLVLHNISSEAKTFSLAGNETVYNKAFFASSVEAKVSKKGTEVIVEVSPYSTLILSK